MDITVVGWFGTETLGDRAILDGILSIFHVIEQKNHVRIGSLFPFYTERTLLEEKQVFEKSAPGTTFSVFDVKDKYVRKENIAKTDIVLVGGGPLMDMEELFIVKKCFECANKAKVPAVIMGCGVGPLVKKDYIDAVKRTFALSDAIWVRDELSVEYMEKVYGNSFEGKCLGDPAVISIEDFKKEEIDRKDYIAVNFRDYPKAEYYTDSIVTDEHFVNLLLELQKEFEKIVLVPMHTFAIGGDDRKYLSKLLLKEPAIKAEVIHKPMNLHDLYRVYAEGFGCVGMRYHSVVMQTILNGNNVVLNYTDKKQGKISGFLESIHDNGFYERRVVDLQNIESWESKKYLSGLSKGERFDYKPTKMREVYVEAVRSVLK